MDPYKFSLLTFLIAFQLLFLALFLITHKKGNRRNNVLLGILFMLIAWNMGDLTLRINEITPGWTFLQYIDDGFLLLYGPIIYMYALGVIFSDFRLSARHLLHLLPFIVFMSLLNFISNALSVTPDKIMSGELPWQVYLFSFLIYIHFFIYLGFTYRSLWKYREIIRNKYSQIDQINLDWLNFMLNTFSLVALLSLIHNFIAITAARSFFMITLVLLLIFIFYFVNKVILKALRQPEIFAGITQHDTVKYHGSYLTTDQIHIYKKRLLELIEREKPYLNPQVSITDLSEKLGIPTKQLSQVINQTFNKSFFDFINSYRVSKVQEILRKSENDKMTILEAMYEAGFNSKSSFNTAFKKETGKTPSEFRKTIK